METNRRAVLTGLTSLLIPTLSIAQEKGTQTVNDFESDFGKVKEMAAELNQYSEGLTKKQGEGKLITAQELSLYFDLSFSLGRAYRALEDKYGQELIHKDQTKDLKIRNDFFSWFNLNESANPQEKSRKLEEVIDLLLSSNYVPEIHKKLFSVYLRGYFCGFHEGLCPATN